MKTYKILFFAFFVILAGRIFSQAGGSIGMGDARSAAMGKTYAVSSIGLRALGNNPANLFQETEGKIEFIIFLPIPSLAGNVGTNFFTINEYNYFFGYKTVDANGKTVGRYLTAADKERFKNIFAEGGAISSDIQIQLFAISFKPSNEFGTVAFSISHYLSGNITFPKGIIDIGLDGNLPNQVYNFNDTKLKAWWLQKISLSYARNLNILPMFQNLSVGLSLNLIQGYAYVGLDHVNTELKTGEGNVITGKGDYLFHSAFSPDFHVKYNFDSKTTKQDFEFSPFPTPAGSGIGVDFGLSAKLNEVLSFGFAITDIGTVTWNKNVAEFSSNKPIYLDDLTSESQRDSLVQALTGKDSGKYINEISTQLATALRFGVAIQIDKMLNGNFPGKLLLALDYNQGFNDQPLNSTKPRFSLGADWVLGVFAFRTGLSFGGFDKFNWGAGIGFDFGIVEMNFGTPDFQAVVSPSSAKRITFAFDSRWKF